MVALNPFEAFAAAWRFAWSTSVSDASAATLGLSNWTIPCLASPTAPSSSSNVC